MRNWTSLAVGNSSDIRIARRHPGRARLLAGTALLALFGFAGVATAQTVNWDGSDSTAWDLGLNWDSSTAPDGASDVVLDTNAANQPVIVGTTTAGTLGVNSVLVEQGQLTLQADGGGSPTLTVTNGTTINGGTVQVLDASVLASTVNIGFTGELLVEGTVSGLVTTGGIVTNNGALTGGVTIGGGTVTGSGTYTGTVTFSGNGSLIRTTTGTIGALVIGAYVDATLSAAAGTTLTQTGSFTAQIPSGSITFGSATETGRVVITANGGSVGGDLSINVAGGTLAGTGPNLGLILAFINNTEVRAGATLDIGVADITVNRLNGEGTVTNSSATDRILTLTNTSTFAGAIDDGPTNNISLVRSGAGTTTLTGASGYTGTTTVAGGTLALGTGSSLASTSITIDAGGTLSTNGEHLANTATVANSGVFAVSGGETIGDLSGAGAVSLLGSGVLTIAGGGTTEVSGNISGTGALTVNKSGGVLTLSGTNSHTGATTLSAGGLTLSGGAAIHDNGAVIVDGGTLTIATNETIGSLSGTGGAVVLGANTLTTAGTGTGAVTYAGTISGAGSFVKGDAGSLTLSGIITADDVDVNGGTLTLTNTGNSIASLDVNGGRLNVTNGAALGGASAIDTTGASTIALSGGTTISRDIAPASGNLDLEVAGASTLGIISGNITAAAGASIGKTGTGFLAISGVVTADTLVVNDGGLQLTANNSIGEITVANAFLNLGSNGAAGGAAGKIVTTGSTIAYAIDGMNNNTPIELQSDTTSLQVHVTAAEQSGVISDDNGARPLEKTGNGTLTLSAANTYGDTGVGAAQGTIVSAGRLNITGSIASNTVSVEAGAGLTLNNAAGAVKDTADIILNGAADLTLGANETVGSVTAANASSTVQLGANTLTVGSGAINGEISGTGGITKTGAGTLALTGTNTYTGFTTISGGTVSINNGAALGSSAQPVNLNGGTLLSTGANVLVNQGFAVNASSTIAAATGTSLTFGTTARVLGATLTIGNAGNAGTVIVTPTSSIGWSPTSLVAIANGTLQMGNAFAADVLLRTIAGTSIDANGILDMAGQNTFVTVLTGTGGVINSGGAATLRTWGVSTFDGVIAAGPSGPTALTVEGGALTLTAAQAYTGATFLNFGDLTLSGGGSLASTNVTINGTRTLTTQGGLATGTVLVNNGSLVLTGSDEIGSLEGIGAVDLGASTLTTGGLNTNTTLSGAVSGAGSLIKVGTGTQTLSGTNTANNLTVQDGTLLLSGNNAGVATVTVGGGVGDARLRVEGGAGLVGGQQITTLGSVVSYGNGVNMATPIAINSDTTQLEVLGADVAEQSGIISDDSGARPLEKIGTGTLTLSADNTYGNTGVGAAQGTTVSAGRLIITGSIDSNTVSVAAGAGLTLNNGVATGAVKDTAAIVLNGAADLTLQASETVGSLSATDTGATVQLGANTLTVGDGTDTTVAGTISGIGGGLTKEGSGTLTLTGTNTYSGPTVINAGTVAINNDAALGASTGNLTLNGGMLLATTDVTVSKHTVSLNGNTTLAAATNQTLTITPTVSIRTMPSVPSTVTIGATGQTGTVVLNPLNSFSRNGTPVTLAVEEGTLRVGNTFAGLLMFNFSFAGTSIGANGTFDLNGLDVNVNALTGTGVVTNGNAANATLRTAGTSNFGGTIQDGAGQTGLTVIGGTTTLTGVNTYTGNTLLSSGDLVLSGGGSIASTNVTINSGRTLTTQGGLAAGAAVTNNGSLVLTGNEEIGSLAGTNAGASVDLGANSLTAGGDGTDTDYAGLISGTGGLTKTGAGTMTLSGASVSFTGQTSVVEGALVNNGTLGGAASVSGTGTLTNAGTISGAVTVDAAGATLNVNGGTNAGTTTNNGGTIAIDGGTLTGLLSNASGTLTSMGTVTASGGLNNAGNATVSGVFNGNVANSGTFSLGGDLASVGHTFTNATGTLNIDAHSFTGLTSLTNGGTVNLVNGGTLGAATVANNGGTINASGGATITGALDNTGAIVDLTAVGGTASNDVLTVTNGLTGGTYRLNADLVAGTSDLINVTGGTVSGALAFEFPPAGSTYLGVAIPILNAPNAGYTFSSTGLPVGGTVVYSLAQAGNNLQLVSEASSGISGIASNASMIQSLMGTVVNRPTGTFAGALPSQEGCSQGGFARSTFGRAEVSGTSNNGVSDQASNVRARYAGIQAGWDYGCNDGRFFDGWDGSFGATVGYVKGKTDQDVLVPVSGGGFAAASVTESDFDQKYAGLYGAISKDRLTTDVQLRFERSSYTLNETVNAGFTGLGLTDAKFSTNSVNLTGRVSYRLDLDDEGLSFAPTAGLSYSRISGATLTFDNDETLRLNGFNSIVGLAGGTVSKTVREPDGTAGTSYFLSGNYYHDFAKDRTSVFSGGGGTQDITSGNIGGFGELSVGVNYVRVLEGSPTGAKQFDANVRADTRIGNNLKNGASLTAQVRLSF